MATRKANKRKPRTKWDPDPTSAKNTYKRANELGRSTEAKTFTSKAFPRSPRAPRHFVPRAGEKNAGITPQRQVQHRGFVDGAIQRARRDGNFAAAARYARLTGGSIFGRSK